MMVIVAQKDPERLAHDAELVRRLLPQAQVETDQDPQQVLDLIRSQPVSIAIMGTDLEEPNSFRLAQRMKRLRPELNLIFTAPDDSLAQQAISIHASGYVLLPLTEENLQEELDDLRYPVRENQDGLFVRCFGDFEVFFNGRPVLFRYQKTKELFAYLIDRRGSVVESDTLVTILWGGETDRSNYFKQSRKDLKDTLERLGLSQCLIRRRGSMGLIPDWIPCDYFDWLKGLPSGIDAYQGEYMRQYDWAESTWINLETKGKFQRL